MSTIVVVDDELDIAEALEALLEDEGYRVFTASNGREGLELVRRMDPDLVLVDMMMPVMGGLEMVARLGEATPRGPAVVMMSAARPQLDPDERPWDVFLPKPFSAKVLLDTVQRLLDGNA